MRDRLSKSLVHSIAGRSGRRMVLRAVALVAILSGIVSVFAQQPTFRSGTQIVSLFATVLDGQKRT
jgi:capsular polysaccharide biosynthesis protein